MLIPYWLGAILFGLLTGLSLGLPLGGLIRLLNFITPGLNSIEQRLKKVLPIRFSEAGNGFVPGEPRSILARSVSYFPDTIDYFCGKPPPVIQISSDSADVARYWLRFDSHALVLNPADADAFFDRALSKYLTADWTGALQDFRQYCLLSQLGTGVQTTPSK